MRKLSEAVGLLVLPLLLFTAAAAARAGDWRVIPGQRIGGVSLGLSRQDVHDSLGVPHHVRRLEHGMVLETWLGAAPTSFAAFRTKYLERNYVSVFYRHGRVVQIEATSDRFRAPGGLTTERPAMDWSRRYPHAVHQMLYWPATDPEVSRPAAKHILLYGDDRAAGLAWKSGCWGDLWPEPDGTSHPEAVIVHRPGTPVLRNPNDADDYSGTGHRRRTA